MEFVEAYEEHVWDVYGFLAYRTKSRQEAEDLTQETFERALRAWSRFDPARASARTWLVVIARNAYIDSKRREGARPLASASADEIETIAVDADERLGPDPELSAALRRLKRREREAIALRFGGDLKTAEVAEVLSVSVANAQQILSRALRELRRVLDGSELSENR